MVSYVSLSNSDSSLEQNSLCTRNLSFPSNNRTARHPDANSQRLERTLRPVVIIVPPNTINVHRNTRALRKTLQTMWNHLAAQIANLFPLETEIYDAKGSV